MSCLLKKVSEFWIASIGFVGGLSNPTILFSGSEAEANNISNDWKICGLNGDLSTPAPVIISTLESRNRPIVLSFQFQDELIRNWE